MSEYVNFLQNNRHEHTQQSSLALVMYILNSTLSFLRQDAGGFILHFLFTCFFKTDEVSLVKMNGGELQTSQTERSFSIRIHISYLK